MKISKVKNLRILLVAMLAVSVSSLASASSLYVHCSGESFRNGSDDVKPNSELFFRIREENEEIKIEKFVGHVLVHDYYSNFNAQEMKANPNYNPRVYRDHIQFPKTNAVASNVTDGGGMWGVFVISKDVFRNLSRGQNFDAHYIFQSGDHLGGAIDYLCKRFW